MRCELCDGSGFIVDEERRRARPCSCRPARMAQKRAAAIAGRIPKRYREVSWEREPLVSIARDHQDVARAVRGYIRRISENLAAGRGIWFTGDTGTGKTTFAMLISKAALEADHTVAIYSLPHLLATLRETFQEQSRFSLTELIDRLTSVELLHIEDVGAEQSSEWVLEQLYTIVNTRYEDGKAILLTTNLVNTPGNMPDVETDEPAPTLSQQIGKRTVSRIFEICGEPQQLFGRDQRLEVPYSPPPPVPVASSAPDPFDEWDDEPPRYGRPPRAP